MHAFVRNEKVYTAVYIEASSSHHMHNVMCHCGLLGISLITKTHLFECPFRATDSNYDLYSQTIVVVVADIL